MITKDDNLGKHKTKTKSYMTGNMLLHNNTMQSSREGDIVHAGDTSMLHM